MFAFLMGVSVGLVVGWNLLPQPEWVLALYNKIKLALEDKNTS